MNAIVRVYTILHSLECKPSLSASIRNIISYLGLNCGMQSKALEIIAQLQSNVSHRPVYALTKNAYIRSHMRAHTCARTHTHTHPCTHTHTHPRTHALTHTHTCMHTHAHTRSHTHMHTHTHTHTRTHTHTYTHTHARAHTHTYHLYIIIHELYSVHKGLVF